MSCHGSHPRRNNNDDDDDDEAKNKKSTNNYNNVAAETKFTPLPMEDQDDDNDHNNNNNNNRTTMLPLEIINSGGGGGGEYDDNENDGLVMRRRQLLGDFNGAVVDPHHGETMLLVGSDLQSAVLGIIKGMVGPAILYLPHGFARAGYLVAIPVLFLSAVLFLASSSCLLESWKIVSCGEMSVVSFTTVSDDDYDYDDHDDMPRLASDPTTEETKRTARQTNNRRPPPPPLSYPDLAYKAFGPKGETIVKIGIAASKFFLPRDPQKDVTITKNAHHGSLTHSSL
jgi:hypothetical protein